MSIGRITELTIAGFKAFDEAVTFPIGQLTLLFGPNSAGKSAIGEAINTLGKLCSVLTEDHESSGRPFHNPGPILARHWRRTEKGYADALQLGCKASLRSDAWARPAMAEASQFDHTSADFDEAVSVLGPWLRRHRELEVGLLLSYEQPTFLETHWLRNEHWYYPSMLISLQSRPILRCEIGGNSAAINLRHPALRRRFQTEGLSRLAARYAAQDCELQGGWFTVHDIVILQDGIQAPALFESAKSLEDSPWTDEHEMASQSFANMFNAIRLNTLRAVTGILTTETVSASRTVPERGDVTYLMDSNGVTLPAVRLGLLPTGQSEFASLTASAFRAEMRKEHELQLPNTEPLEPDGASNTKVHAFAKALITSFDGGYVENAQLKGINRLLMEYVFRERGYCLAADVYELVAVDRSGPKNIETPLATDGVPHRYLVSLVLRDNAARTFNFDEIGSGIGYVLPVLVRLVSGGRVYIQQPELHLHPALQAELADAFVARLNEADDQHSFPKRERLLQCIVETHSEHFLLRLLRRVRQSRVAEKTTNIHALDREQVVVLYVEPDGDGTSTVKHLRISRDGDFIDRWPRGFFDERWKELFDE